MCACSIEQILYIYTADFQELYGHKNDEIRFETFDCRFEKQNHSILSISEITIAFPLKIMEEFDSILDKILHVHTFKFTRKNV